ncbi:hypothetical protein EVAR_85968_1 [Eumeta japonica]|uniref:Uncharacterized protein n=1 Tax=Eumeta variegata TaxID=151549 RepID=A0A4C1UKG5_EUMVA|nr:hypothetical protein EVAR_85968_1 [Eumeta japonica]
MPPLPPRRLREGGATSIGLSSKGPTEIGGAARRDVTASSSAATGGSHRLLGRSLSFNPKNEPDIVFLTSAAPESGRRPARGDILA